MVSRIKVVNDPGELVSIFHAADTDVKRKLLLDLSTNWITLPVIEERYGKEGKKSLLYLDKIKMIETQWITGDNGPEKAYHTYYTSVQINMMGSLNELADVIYAATLSDEDLQKYEEKIRAMMKGNEGVFIGDISESLNISQTLIKGIVKRSSILEIKGYKIELANGVQ